MLWGGELVLRDGVAGRPGDVGGLGRDPRRLGRPGLPPATRRRRGDARTTSAPGGTRSTWAARSSATATGQPATPPFDVGRPSAPAMHGLQSCQRPSSATATVTGRQRQELDDDQRVRSVQDRHRAVKLAHGRARCAPRCMFARVARRPDGADRPGGRVRAELFGSLGATGHGHGSVKASAGPARARSRRPSTRRRPRPGRRGVRETGRLTPPRSGHEIDFDPDEDIVLHRRKRLPFHPNAMRFAALDSGGARAVSARTYYSVGGGFVLGEDEAGRRRRSCRTPTPVPYPFSSGAELLAQHHRDRAADQRRDAGQRGWSGGPRPRSGPGCWRSGRSCRSACARGCEADGVLPGGLKVRRRAPGAARDPGAHRGHRRPAVRDGVGRRCTRWPSTRRTRRAAGW